MDPYIGEIRMFAGNFAPVGWVLCRGQLLAIAEYDTLFNLIGTTYGGDGQNTFAVPDLAGRVPIHFGQGLGLTNRQIGEQAGTEEVTLTANQMPSHRHDLMGNHRPATSKRAAGSYLAEPGRSFYAKSGTLQALPPNTLAAAGSAQPHANLMPFTVANFIIATFGIYPSPT